MRVIHCSAMNNDILIFNVWSVLFLKSKLGVFHFDSLESDYGWMHCYVMMDFLFFTCYICSVSDLGFFSLHLIWTGLIFVIAEFDLGNCLWMNFFMIFSLLYVGLLVLWWTMTFWYTMCQLLYFWNLIWAFHFDSLESDYG